MTFFNNSSNPSQELFCDYGPIPMEIDNSNELESVFPEVSSKIVKKRKATIPKRLKSDVWDFYIGEEKGIALCMCCNHEKIKASHFECGHVISEFNGGTLCIENLRPICSQCNRSMSKKNMNEFMEKCGYKFPNNWMGKKIDIYQKNIRKNKIDCLDRHKDVEVIVLE
jgi:hypothetical protein